MRLAKIAVAMAALGITLGAGAPAYAASPANPPGSGATYSLPIAPQTHRCEKIGDDGTDTSVLCVELALYTTEAGKYDVTLQVEGYCMKDDGGAYVTCDAIVLQPGTVASNSYQDWTEMQCLPDIAGYPDDPCQSGQSGRTYFWPFGGIPITVGSCVDNVWGVLSEGSIILPGDPQGEGYLNNNLETGHWDFCLNKGNAVSATAD